MLRLVLLVRYVILQRIDVCNGEKDYLMSKYRPSSWCYRSWRILGNDNSVNIITDVCISLVSLRVPFSNKPDRKQGTQDADVW